MFPSESLLNLTKNMEIAPNSTCLFKLPPQVGKVYRSGKTNSEFGKITRKFVELVIQVIYKMRNSLMILIAVYGLAIG